MKNFFERIKETFSLSKSLLDSYEDLIQAWYNVLSDEDISKKDRIKIVTENMKTFLTKAKQ